MTFNLRCALHRDTVFTPQHQEFKPLIFFHPWVFPHTACVIACCILSVGLHAAGAIQSTFCTLTELKIRNILD
jgi:hypothetical protein